MFKLVNEDSEKLQKILKFLHNTPYQGLLEGFSDFWAPAAASRKPYFLLWFLQIFYKLLRKSSEILFRRCRHQSRKNSKNPPSHLLYTLLCASQQPKNSTISPKNFRQLSTRLYRTCRQDATLGANIYKRVHSNTSLEGSPQPPRSPQKCAVQSNYRPECT